jgi:segregation and condensation protein B
VSDKAEPSLADEVAEWRPPWQRGEETPAARPDTPPDEPSAETDEYARAVTAASEADDASQTGPQPRPQAEPQTGPHDESPIGPELRSEPEAPVAPAAVPDDVDLGAVIEAILMVAEEPLGEEFLSSVLERPLPQVRETLSRLSAEYTGDGRGFDLRRQAGGWRFYTRADYARYVERFVTDGASSRLTKAAMETLAVVAYRQPVTRGRISAIRGVNCDGVIRTLLARGLVEECGSDPDSTATLYRTTTLFLEKLGLDSVAQLPELAPFLPDDVTDIEDDEQS